MGCKKNRKNNCTIFSILCVYYLYNKYILVIYLISKKAFIYGK